MSEFAERLPFRISPTGFTVAWGFAAAIAGVATGVLEPNMLEEGIVVHSAERMANGDHLYRDIVFFTGPLPFELLAALFRVFGAKIEMARALVIVLQAVSTALIYQTVRAGGTRAGAHLAAAVIAGSPVLLFPLFSIYYYTTLAFYLGLIAIHAGTRGGDNARWAVATGAIISMVALCKQNTGVFFAAAFVPAFAMCAPRGQRARRTLQLVAGGAIVAAATVSFYAARGDLGALIYGLIELPLSMGETFRMPYPNLWPLGRFAPLFQQNWLMYVPSLYYLKFGFLAELGPVAIAGTQILYAVPFIALAGTAILAFRRSLSPAAWLNGAFLVAMTLNLFPRADWGHLVVALPPAGVQFALVAGRLPGASRIPRTLVRLGAPAATAAFVLCIIGVGAWLQMTAGPATFGPKIPLRPVSPTYKSPAIPRVINYLLNNVPPGEEIFIPRQEPLLYFATRTVNPTPFEGVFPGLKDLQEPLILAALEDVRYVVLSDIDQPLYTYYADEMPGVQAYLERHFRIPGNFRLDDLSWILVLRRSRDRGATAFDLIDHRQHGRPFVVDLEGARSDPPNEPPRLAARHLHRPLPLVLGPGGAGIDYDVEIPPDAVFLAGVGFRGMVSVEDLHEHPPGITMVVSVREENGEFEDIHSVKVNDGAAAGRKWTPMEVDLSRFAGRRVTLRLEVRPRWKIPPDNLAWWGSPRIALRPERD